MNADQKQVRFEQFNEFKERVVDLMKQYTIVQYVSIESDGYPDAIWVSLMSESGEILEEEGESDEV